MGTDSELSSPDQSLMIATVRVRGRTLSFDLFKLIEGKEAKLLKIKEHAAIIGQSSFYSAKSAKTINFTHGRVVWRNQNYSNNGIPRGPVLT